MLLDYDLPDGKGAELLPDLRQRGLIGRVIAVSSRDENNAQLLAAGVFAAVNKMRFAAIRAVLEQLGLP